MDRHNSSDLRSLMESYKTLSESAIDMPAANTPAHVDPKPAEPFPKDRVKRDKAEAPKSLRKEHEDLMAAYYAVYDRKEEFVEEEEEVAEAMSSYDRNRKRAAQRAAERNAARAAGKTGVVPGVGYVSPRKERETYVDSAGTTRHKSGARMEETEATDEVTEAMSSYDRNRKRAAQRAAERNAARAAGKTGVVPGVGYVSPRKERETYVDSAGTTRHKSGAKMEETEYVDEAITSEKGKAKMKAMLDARTTASGRAKKGKGDNVAQIKHVGRSEREGLSGTPMTPTIAKNPAKSRTITGTGNKAARRAAELNREDVELDTFDLILEYLKDMGFPTEDAIQLMATMEDAEQLYELSTDTLNSYMDKAEKERETKLSKAKDQAIKSRMAKHFGKDKKAKKLHKKALDNYSKAEKRDDSIDQAYAKVQKAQGTESDLLKKFPPKKGANVPAQKSNMISRAKAKVRKALRREENEEIDFDLILEYLTDRGFPEEDAMQIMATMDDEKRETVTSEAVSWDKYGRPKDPKARAEAQRKAAEMRMKDKAAGRSRYGSKTGYAKKDWDE